MNDGINASEQAVVASEDDPARQAELGRTLLEQGHMKEAEQALRRAIRLHPDEAAYHADLARVLLGLGRREDAVEELREAKAYDLGNAAYHAELGQALLDLGRGEEAVPDLREAVQYEPDNPAYLADLGRALLDQGQLSEAEDALREAARLDPANAAYQAGLGRALLDQDRLSEAADVLREAARLDPANAAYLADLGRALLDQDHHLEAEALLREAVHLDPANADYRADLGQVLLRMNRLPEAETALREAAQLDPDAGNTKVTDLRTALSTAYDERILAFVVDQVGQTWDKNALEQRGVVRHEYVDHVERITRSRLPALRVPFKNWADAQQAEHAERLAILSRNRARFRIALLSNAVLAVPIAAAFLIFFYISGSATARAVIAASVAGVGLLAASTAYVLFQRRVDVVRPRVTQASFVLEDQFRTLVTNLILEPAITAALAIVWNDSSADPVRIQDGPELSAKADISNVVSTEAHSRLTIALNRRNGAAVGVAGPRGSGKTELARAFTELRPSDPKSRTIPLMLWAPVRYDAQTFLLRLLKELCLSVLATGAVIPGDNGLIFTSRGRRVAFAVAACCLAAAGTALVVIKATSTKVGPEVPFVVGGLLIVIGLVAGVFLFRRQAPHRRRGVGMSPDTISRAADLRTRAEFTETYTRSSQLGVSGHGLSLSATGGTQLARIPLNEVDVVRELYALVRSAEAGGWQVIIAIDELDKMQDDAEAIKFLNHIKVLFPIHNCSFIVSVSENAWARFENRGIPFRDAFDSSFDEIVHVLMLRPRESRDLLKRRNTSISDAQALLCHCLSGGLPRDLLRAIRLLARMASHMQKGGAMEPPQLAEVLNVMLEEDLREKIAAFEIEARDATRANVSEANLNSVTCWSHLWRDLEQTQRRLADARGASGDRQAAPAAGGPGGQGSQGSQAGKTLQPEFQAYIGVLHTIRQAFSPDGPLARLVGQEEGFDHELIEHGFDRIARARRSISTDIDSAWQLLDEARQKLGLRPIRPADGNLDGGRLQRAPTGAPYSCAW